MIYDEYEKKSRMVIHNTLGLNAQLKYVSQYSNNRRIYYMKIE